MSSRPRPQNELDFTVDNEQDNGGNSSLRPSQLLPQSPLITHPQPSKEKKRKQCPTQEDLDSLKKNPWAVALASPVRMCVVTGTRLPKAFLSDYGLFQRPESDRLWFLPSRLVRDDLTRPSPRKDFTDAIAEHGTSMQDESPQRRTSDRSGLSTKSLRVVTRLPLLKQLTNYFVDSKTVKSPRVSRILPIRWKPPLGPITNKWERKLVWREDMPDFVLGRMRREVVNRLARVCSRQGGVVGDNNDAIQSIELETFSEVGLLNGLSRVNDLVGAECGAVLIVGSYQGSRESIPSANDVGEARPPDLIMLPGRQSKVPVFDLTVLLSEDYLAELKRCLPQPEATAFFFRPDDPMGAEAMLSVWRLQCFIREDKS